MKRKLIYLEWIDAVGPADSGWLSDDGLKEMLQREMAIQEVGFLIAEDKDYISLVAGLSEEPAESEWNSHYHRLIRIPKQCVKKRKDLTKHI